MYWLALLAIPASALALRPGASPSRRLLAFALAVLVPVAGAVLALLVRRVRGGGIATEPPAVRPVRRLSASDVARLGELPPALDRLLASDPGERLEALVGLSSAGDAVAVETLRWAVEHGPSDTVLDAALTLEELELRAEARAGAARAALGDGADRARMRVAADAAAAQVLSGIADPAVAPSLAADACAWYRQILDDGEGPVAEIGERVARLELAVGRPGAALALLERLVPHDGASGIRLAALREEAAFAAREFGVLSFLPRPLEVPIDLAACKLQSRSA